MNRLAPLATAFVVLAALVAWRETTRGGATDIVAEANLKPLQTRAFVPDDVESVEITAPGGDKPAYSLVRENKSWRVIGDFKAPAAGASVSKLLDALAKAEGDFRSDDKSALEQFGLTHAKAVGVRALDKDKKELLNVAVGATANSRGAFVRDLASGADDSKAYAVSADLRGMLGLSRTSVGDHAPDKPDPAHFYDKEFPQLAVEKPVKAEFTAPGRVVVFEKTKKDDKDKTLEWRVASGGPDAPLKKEPIDTAIAKLGGSFHPSGLVDPAKKKDLGFDAPKYRLAVTTETGSPRVVVATSDAAAEHFYVRLETAQDPEVVYEANEYEFHQLFPTGSSLFDLPKVDTGKDGPTRVVVEKTDREPIEITRKGVKTTDDWTLVRPAWPLTAKQTSLRSLSTKPAQLHVVDYVDDAKAPDAEITVRFGAADAPDDQMKTIVVGGKAPAGKDRLATLPDKPGRVFVVQETLLDQLAPEPLSLFDTKIFKDWKSDDVTAVRASGRATVLREGDEWKLESGAEKPAADKAAVTAWIEKLLALDVAGTAAAAKDEGFTTIVVERKQGTPLSMDVGPVADGKRVVKIGEFRATVNDVAGLLPEATSLLAKPAAPPKTDEPPKPSDDKK